MKSPKKLKLSGFCAPALVAVVILNSLSFATSGAPDYSFGVSGLATVNLSLESCCRILGMALQPDGKTVAAGITIGPGGFATFTVFRFRSNGTLDPEFDGDGMAVTQVGGLNGSSAWDVAVQNDGRIVAVGVGPNGFSPAVVRYNSDGSVQSSFQGNGSSPKAVAIQQDGKIVVGGYGFGSVQNDFIVERFNSNGTLDTTFGGTGRVVTQVTTGSDSIEDIAIQSDGKIVAVGRANNDSDAAIVRYNVNGSLDTTFDGDGMRITSLEPTGSQSEYWRSVIVHSDGRIFVGGNTGPRGFAGAFNSDGSPNTSFDSDGILLLNSTNQVDEIRLQPDNRILLIGTGGVTAGVLTVQRVFATGMSDPSFGVAGLLTRAIENDFATAAAEVSSDNKLVVLGNYKTGSTWGLAVHRMNIAQTITPADYDGDNRTDLSVFRPSNGQWWLNRSTSGLMVHTFGNSNDTPIWGDFTGDASADVAIFRSATGEWFILRSEDSTFYSFPFGSPGDAVVPADYDGDGRTDPAVFRPSNSTWYIQRSSGGTTIQTFGASTDRPVPADYDGDGKVDIAIYRPSLGQWWINRSTAGLIVHTFGNSADRNVPGDYTGDGKADVAIWRPSNGEWYILRSEDFSFYSFPFGVSTDLPVPGDYDGDGRTDPGVFRPSTGNWFVNRSTSGLLIQGFGTVGDVPVPGAFVR